MRPINTTVKKAVFLFSILITILGFSNKSEASTLNPGDVALITANMWSQDTIEFVLMKEISGTTEMHITLAGWDTVNTTWSFSTTNHVTWTYTGDLPCGTVVTLHGLSFGTASHGALSGSMNGTGSPSGGSITFYQGTSGDASTASFIWCFNYNTNGFAVDAQGDLFETNVPAGLTEGENAVSMTQGPNTNFSFTCQYAGTDADSLRSALCDVSNYTLSNGDGPTVYNSCTFDFCPCVMSPTINIADVNCTGGNDGSATAIPGGGVGPYTFLWGDFFTDSVRTNLSAGNVFLTVTDATGCMGTANDTINQPAGSPLNVGVSVTNAVSCPNGTDGELTASAANGTSPYTYTWSVGGPGSVNSNLPSSSYFVTVTDAAGCTATNSQTLQIPNAISVGTFVDNNVTCHGGADGAATAFGSGGQSPFTYAWGSGATTDGVTGLNAGNHGVTVTDALGCTESSIVTISEPGTPMDASVSIDNTIDCFGDGDGGASASPTGNNGPATYLWSNAATTASISSLSGGTYTCTVTDSLGCTAIDSAIIVEPTMLTANASGTNITCVGQNDGTATLNQTGGTTPYAFIWSDGQTIETAVGLAPGIYSGTVTDANGCVASDATVNSDVLCSDPGGLNVKNVQPNEGTGTWFGVCGVTTYMITYWEASNPAGKQIVFSYNSKTQKKLIGLSPNTKYKFHVRSWCGVSGSWSDASVIKKFTTTINPCNMHTGLSTSPVRVDEARMNWTPEANSTKIKLRWRVQGTSTWTELDLAPTSTKYWATGLTAGTGYEWQIENFCTYGVNIGTGFTAIQQFTTPVSKMEDTFAAVQEDEMFKLFPNPNNGQFSIVTPSSENAVDVIVTDANGKVIRMVQAIGGETTPINMDGVSSGVYFLNAKGETLNIHKKVIVQ